MNYQTSLPGVTQITIVALLMEPMSSVSLWSTQILPVRASRRDRLACVVQCVRTN